MCNKKKKEEKYFVTNRKPKRNTKHLGCRTKGGNWDVL
jgi:hypothetical protein